MAATGDPGRPAVPMRGRLRLRLLAAAATLAALLSIASPALANEPHSSETLDAPWSATGPGSVGVSSNGTSPPAHMSYSIKPAGLSEPKTWTFSTMAATAGTKNLTYSYSGWHGSLMSGTVFLTAYVTHGGSTSYTPLASTGLGSNGSFSYSGELSLEVQAGDTYGFEFGGMSDDSFWDEMYGGLTVGIQNGLPVNTALPEVTGAPYVGVPVSAANGTWESFRGAVSYSYQWMGCNSSGESCLPLWGATSSTFTPEPSQVGKTLRVRVTARNEAGESTAESAPSTAVPEVNWIEGFMSTYGSESAEILGMVELAAGPGGQQLPPFSQLCAQWRRTPAEAWSQHCVELYVSNEYSVGCFDIGSEMVLCETPVSMTGLTPGTEYEWRMTASAAGQEAQSQTWSLLTEGEGPPRAAEAPPLSGSATPGESLEATSPGGWSGVQPIEFSYSWERCVQETHACTAIPGAGSPGYSIPVEDVAKTSESPYAVRVRVTAKNSFGEAAVTSEEREVRAAPAMFTTSEPALEGEAQEGQTLEIIHYAIGGAPAPAVTYEWQRCDPAGEVCEAIGGATGSSYVVTAEDVGHTVRAVIQANNTEYVGGGEASEATAVSGLVTTPPCTAGSWSATGKEPCAPAAPGHYAPGSGATAQFACLAGTYDPEEGSVSPVACLQTPPGAWSGNGAAGYTKCPAGTYQPNYSATMAAACLTDPPGTYTAEFAWEVNPCAAGTYAAGNGNTGCTPAEPGYYVDSAEAVAQTPCPAGTYTSSGSSTGCTEAPAGSYDSGEASTGPTPCPAGTYAEAARSTSCTATPPNTYSPGGVSRPVQCPAGTGAPTGASSCTAVSSEHGGGSPGGPPQMGSPGAQPAPGSGGSHGGVRPTITAVSVSHRCISASAFLTRKKTASAGTLTFRLNEAARVAYSVSRLGASARPPSCAGRSARAKKGSRPVTVGSGSKAFGGGRGTLSITRELLAGHSRSVAPGGYKLTLVASSPSGARSATVSVEVWVLRSSGHRRG